MKNGARHQHNKNRYSRITTPYSCFALIWTRQPCVEKICNASPRANAHKLQNDPYTISSPYFELTCTPKHALPHHLFRGVRRPKWSCLIGVSKTQKINLLGQGQPKHLNIQPHGQCYALKTQRFGSLRWQRLSYAVPCS